MIRRSGYFESFRGQFTILAFGCFPVYPVTGLWFEDPFISSHLLPVIAENSTFFKSLLHPRMIRKSGYFVSLRDPRSVPKIRFFCVIISWPVHGPKIRLFRVISWPVHCQTIGSLDHLWWSHHDLPISNIQIKPKENEHIAILFSISMADLPTYIL